MFSRARFGIACLLLTGVLTYGCHSSTATTPVQAETVPPPVRAIEPAAPAATLPATPLKDALTVLLTQGTASPFPKGTQLLNLNLKEGVATLDFSKEFNALANSGDSVESMAQKSLCATLAKFPEVQRMRVTVEGKPFDSQNTDWSTPFPVRSSVKTTPSGGQSEDH